MRVSNFAGGKRAWNSVVTVKIIPSTTAWASAGETSFTMLISCVLVSSMIRCDSTTCDGSPGSQVGVMRRACPCVPDLAVAAERERGAQRKHPGPPPRGN